MIKDLFLLAIKNIKARKLRNSLTILGIVIGIAAIITLITMSQGLESSVTEQFEKIGANRIFVMAKGGSAFQLGSGLTDDDVKILGFINELEWITPYTTKQTVITFGREKELLTIWGVPYNKIKERWESFGLNIDKGRYPKKSETYAAVIGAQLAQEGFAREIRINNNIEIEEKKFTVVGIFEEIGTPEDDNIIYINGETAQEIFNKENDFSFIDLTVKSAYDPSTIANKIERRLRQSRGIKGSDDADFEVVTPEQLLGQMRSVLLIIQVILISIAAIALIVGAIGIANAMFTSVLERTREIGVMKAVGATQQTIKYAFLIEAGIIGGIGGSIGTLIGAGVALVIGEGLKSAGYSFFSITLSPWLLLSGIIFGLVIGGVSGLIPAYKASQKHPIEALRQ